MSESQTDARRAKVIGLLEKILIDGNEPDASDMTEYALKRWEFMRTIAWDQETKWGDLVETDELIPVPRFDSLKFIGLTKPLWKKTESDSIWRMEAVPDYNFCAIFQIDPDAPYEDIGKLHTVLGVSDRLVLTDWHEDQSVAIDKFTQVSGNTNELNESDADDYWDRYDEVSIEAEKEEVENDSAGEKVVDAAIGDDAFYSRYDEKMKGSESDPKIQFKQDLENQIREAGHKARILGYQPDEFKVLVMDSLYKVMGTR